MADLIFRYGTMGSSKTADAIMVNYNYRERGLSSIIIKPDGELRDGFDIVKSRIGINAKAKTISWLKERVTNMYQEDMWDCIVVDEAQFLSVQDVDFLANIVDEKDCNVICYGLRTDFLGNLFEGSARLMAIADIIEEKSTVCWCGKKSLFNARIKNGKIERFGKQIKYGGNNTYVSLCRKHYNEGMIYNPKDVKEK